MANGPLMAPELARRRRHLSTGYGGALACFLLAFAIVASVR